jgi:hypothetical protein
MQKDSYADLAGDCILQAKVKMGLFSTSPSVALKLRSGGSVTVKPNSGSRVSIQILFDDKSLKPISMPCEVIKDRDGLNIYSGCGGSFEHNDQSLQVLSNMYIKSAFTSTVSYTDCRIQSITFSSIFDCDQFGGVFGIRCKEEWGVPLVAVTGKYSVCTVISASPMSLPLALMKYNTDHYLEISRT